MRRLLTIAIAAGALASAAAIAWVALSTISSDQFLFLPGPAQPVAPVVQVAGEATDPPADGPGLLYVAIGIRRASLREAIFGPPQRGAALVPEDAVLAPGQSQKERAAEDRELMSTSQKVAAIVALRELGKEVDVPTTGAVIESVMPDGPAATAGIEAGDVIVAVDGEPVAGWQATQAALKGLAPGDTVVLRTRRAGEAPRDATITTIASDPADGPTRALVGVVRGEDELGDVKLPVDVGFSTKEVGGPSAGLAFALEIHESLSGRALTHATRVAVTGALAIDGTVLPIGGVEQKAVGAWEAGAELFLVPEENLEAARVAAPEGLEVVGVGTFAEALAALRAADPVHA